MIKVNFNQKPDRKPNEAHELFKDGVRCIMWANDYKEALKCFNKAIMMRDDQSDYYYWRALARKHLKQFRGAVNDFNKAVELNPETFNILEIYNERGMSYGYLTEYENALLDFNKAIELKPQCAEYYDNRGITYFNMKEYQKAVDDFDMAIKLAPDKFIYYKDRAEAVKHLK